MSSTSDKAFIGVGWNFPVRLEAAGSVATAMYDEDVRQAILLILETAQGERVMRPDFGAGLQTLLFETLSTTTMSLAKHRVEEALITWEPRIDLIDVLITASGEIRNRLDIEIQYRVRATNTFYNLVYPFYLQEGTETRP